MFEIEDDFWLLIPFENQCFSSKAGPQRALIELRSHWWLHAVPLCEVCIIARFSGRTESRCSRFWSWMKVVIENGHFSKSACLSKTIFGFSDSEIGVTQSSDFGQHTSLVEETFESN